MRLAPLPSPGRVIPRPDYTRMPLGMNATRFSLPALVLGASLTLGACVTVTEERLNVPNPAPDQSRQPMNTGQTLAVPPQPTHQPVNYPDSALEAGERREAMVQVMVLPDGSAGDRVLVQTSGSATLDEAALTSVGQWRFEPARDTEGQPMEMVLVVPVRFSR